MLPDCRTSVPLSMLKQAGLQHHSHNHDRDGGTACDIPLQPLRDWLSPACTHGPPSWFCFPKELDPRSIRAFSCSRVSLSSCHRRQVGPFRSPCSTRARWRGWLWFRWGTFWSTSRRSKRCRLPVATYLHLQHIELVRNRYECECHWQTIDDRQGITENKMRK